MVLSADEVHIKKCLHAKTNLFDKPGAVLSLYDTI